MKFRSIIAGALALVLSASLALAQDSQGSSPLTPSKGGTNSAFVGFTGPATSVKTFTLPNVSGTIALLGQIQTWSAQQTFVAPILGTPASVTLTNATGLPIATGVSGLGTNIAAFLATPSSANLRAALTDETGTGPAVFGTSPNITTPTGIVKGDVGLGNVDNTSDANKPVSTAQAAADALKVNLTRNISTGCGLAGGGDLSADRTIRLSLTINAQTGTSYTVLDGDCGKLVSFNNASAVAVTLPQANGSTFISGWSVDFQNKGAGTVTVTPTTSTINGGGSAALAQNQGMHCDSDGTNYTCVLGVGAGGGSGTVTQVVCGTGLTGGTITASGTCAVDYATKSDQQTGTATAKTVNSARQQDHPSALKAHAYVSTASPRSPSVTSGYNVSGCTSASTGLFVCTFSPTAFLNATAFDCMANIVSSSGPTFAFVSSQTASTVSISTMFNTTLNDPTTALTLHCAGTQ